MPSAGDAKPLVGLLLGEAPTPEKAATIAGRYGACPYCVSYTCAGCTTVGVFSVPADRRWWLEWAAAEPKHTLGLTRAELLLAEDVPARSAWSRGETEPLLQRAPCGAVCLQCPKYHGDCKGCPATRYYLAG